MAHDREKQELQSKLARYEALARQYSDDPTYEQIRREIEALERQLRAVER